MITIKPDFYDNFKCIASKCTDNCCIGWEIDIDDTTKEKYDNIEGTFSEKLHKNIGYNGQDYYFKLAKNDRCPFLNEDNLCELILNCGEDMLCDICREHPRFYEWYENYTDMGIGLCCEEACGLLFENNDSLNFMAYDDGKDEDDEFINSIVKTRSIAFNLIANRKDKFNECIINLINFGKAVQNKFFAEIEEKATPDLSKTEVMEKLLALFEKCEPFDENYPILISKIKESIDEIEENKNAFHKYLGEDFYAYEKLLTYIIFRYYMKALYDGDLQSKITFSLINLWLVECIDVLIWLKAKTYNTSDRINSVKDWSKQIEYSDENINLLISELRNNLELNGENIIKLF